VDFVNTFECDHSRVWWWTAYHAFSVGRKSRPTGIPISYIAPVVYAETSFLWQIRVVITSW